MAKRTGFKYHLPRSKMPKLDITVSSSQWIPPPGPSHLHIPQPERMKPIVQVPLPQSADIWGDADDEEFILLASQAAEKVEANAELVISQAMNSGRNIDMSYGQFRREVQTSTQIKSHEDNLIDSFMCSNDDEDIFLKLPDFGSRSERPVENGNNNQNQKGNKINDAPGPSCAFVVPLEPALPPRTDQQKSAKVKMNAQQTYLTEKLKSQKKEIENLKENLSKLTEKCQTKEGEASTLRYELQLNKQQSDRIRKDKMAEIDQLEKDFSDKVATLEKLIETQRSEIEFKNLKMLHKKSKKSLNASLSYEHEHEHEQVQLPDYDLHNLFKLQTTTYVSNSDFTESALNPSVANYLSATWIEPSQALNQKDTNISNSLHLLQTTYNSIKFTNKRQVGDKTLKQILELTTELVSSLQIYADQLELHSLIKFNPTVECMLLSETAIRAANGRGSGGGAADSSSKINCAQLIAGDKLIYERRMLALIAMLCMDYAEVTAILLDPPERFRSPQTDNEAVLEIDEINENETFVVALAEILTTIGFSKSLHLHKGLIEAASLLLSALSKNNISSEKSDTSLLMLFKAIVSCQPEITSLHHLTQFLEAISKPTFSDSCNKLCLNKNSNLIIYRRYNIKRFSPDTCPLQIYAGLLETAFAQYDNVQLNASFLDNMATLTSITISLMTFLRNCFKRPVVWLYRKTEDGSEICHCYCYIVSCTIVLLHLCIKYWIQDSLCLGIKTIGTIFKMAALFLQDNFNQHYEAKVLNLGGFSIKNRLQMIYDWIVFYQSLFKFGDSHSHAIQSVNLRRFICEPQKVSTEVQQRLKDGQNEDTDCAVLLNTFDNFSMNC